MIIHEPEILIKDGRAISWARVETSQKSGFFPENIWYRVAEEHASFLGVQSDVFLVASILGAMYYGEDVWVRGSVSPRLAYRLDEYQHVMRPSALARDSDLSRELWEVTERMWREAGANF